MNDSFALKEKNQILGGTLYLVATPIGNISDLSERARKVLSEVDFIAAEDTRNSGKLLSLLGLGGKSMVSYFEHNKAEKGPQILKRLKEGRSCALVTDAGTPAISDPGADLVALCIQEGVPVTAVAQDGYELLDAMCGLEIAPQEIAQKREETEYFQYRQS